MNRMFRGLTDFFWPMGLVDWKHVTVGDACPGRRGAGPAWQVHDMAENTESLAGAAGLRP